MKFKFVWTSVLVVGLGFANIAFAAGDNDTRESYEVATSRPAALTGLYASLVATNVWDVYSTSAALRAGAHEANPTAAPFASNTGAMLGLKMATTAGTILFSEQVWKKTRGGAVMLLVLINGATAVVALHNMRNARVAARR